MKSLKRKRTRRSNRFVPSFQSLETRRLLVGELLELHLGPRDLADQAILPDAGDVVNLSVGDRFDVEVSYSDLRTFEDRIGAFQLLTDIAVSQPDVVVPVLKEAQFLTFDELITSTPFDSVTFSIEGSATTHVSTSGEFASDPIEAISTALQAFGYTTSDFDIVDVDFGNNDRNYRIRYTGDQFGNVDVPNIDIEVNETNPTDDIPTASSNVPALTPSGTPNPDAVRFSLKTESRTFNNDQIFYGSVVQGSYEPVTQNVTGIGGVGPVAALGGGIPALTNDGSFINPFDAYSIEYEVIAPATNVVFSVAPADSSEATILYGNDQPVPPELVLLDSDSMFTATFTAATSFTTNPTIPEDVTYDGNVSLLDGLLIANALDLVDNLPESIGVEGDGTSLDVNADGNLTPNDLVRVLNFLGSTSDNTGELLALQVDALSPTSFESLLDNDRNLVVPVGEEFLIQLSYQDLRPEADRLGALSVFADLSVSNPATISPVIGDGTFAENILPGLEYQVANSSEFQGTETETFNELGGVGPVSDSGLTETSGSIEVLTFSVIAADDAENVVFELDLPENVASEIQLYGMNDPLTPNGISLGANAGFTATFLAPGVSATSDATTIAEDTVGLIDVIANDFVPDGQTSELSVSGASQSGGVTEVVDGQIRYTPPANFFGEDSFEYTVTTNGPEPNNTSTAEVFVTVTAVDDPPVASNDSFTTMEDLVLSVTFAEILANDDDGDGGGTSGVTVTLGTPSSGAISTSADGFTYLPPADFSGSDLLTYTISDATGSATAEILITVDPVNDPPIAGDDSVRVNPGETSLIPVDTLLANDFAGPEESDQVLSISVGESSQEGGTLSLDDGQVVYTPADGFSGTDSFSYTLSDGDLTAIGNVTLDVSFELGPARFDLPQDQANDVTFRLEGDDFVVISNVNDEILFQRPANTISVFTIAGANDFTDKIRADHSGGILGNSFDIDVFGGTGAGDELIISGSGDSSVSLGQDSFSSTISDLIRFFVSENQHGRVHTGFEFETISIDGMLHIESHSLLNVGSAELNLSSTTPVNLFDVTQLDGGVIRSDSPLGIGAGESLIGSGLIEARIAGDVGSLIRATGDLTLGDADSPAGFETAGDLEVGQHTVVLQDSNQSVLGGLTTIGNDDGAGTLASSNGFVIDFGDNVVGQGTLDSTDSADTVVTNNGEIVGDAETDGLTLTGFIKGVGTFDNTTVAGTFSPGFSPAIANLGSVIYAEGSKILIELGGSEPGTGYDQIIHNGLAIVNGLIDVDLINGFLPSAGERFDIFQSTETINQILDNLNLPQLANGLQWIINQTDTGLSIEVGLDVEGVGGEITVSVVDGELVVLGADGEPIPIAGQKIRITVDPNDVFESEQPFTIVGTEVVDGVFVQKATDGKFEFDVVGGNWTNFVKPADVDGSGVTTALDALVIVNQLSRGTLVEPGTSVLIDPAVVAEFPDLFYDANGDGSITALDALNVINRIAQDLLLANGEEIAPADSADASPDVVNTLAAAPASVRSTQKIASFDQAIADWTTEEEETLSSQREEDEELADLAGLIF